MQRGQYVEGLSGQLRLQHAMRAAAARGSAEASWILVEGDPGYGKTKQIARIAVQQRDRTAFIRAKAKWTTNWMLTELGLALGAAPARRTADLFRNIMAELMKRDEIIILVDEFQHTIRNIELIETLRDITDTAECILIASGNKGCFDTLNRYEQVRSRIVEFVPFGPATDSDLRKLADALCEVKLSDDMIALLQKETRGRIRDVLNALGRVEAAMKTHRGAVTAADWLESKKPLMSTNRPQLVSSNG